MSEDFDKEAERRRLREKYEQDKADRESTERMSELLLKGATMTNRHCDTCGSPIFRYQGQAFCPNCQAEAQAAAEESEADQQAAAATDQREATAQQQAADPQPAGQQATDDHPSADQPAAQHPGEQSGQQSAQQPTAPRRSASDVDDASLEGVQASLTRTLATFARRAAETDDPRRAREYLETAKVAAETLRALP